MKGEKHAANFYEIPFTGLGGTCPWIGVAQNNRGEPVTAVWLRLEFKRGTNKHFAHPSKALKKKRKKKVTKVDTSLWTRNVTIVWQLFTKPPPLQLCDVPL